MHDLDCQPGVRDTFIHPEKCVSPEYYCITGRIYVLKFGLIQIFCLFGWPLDFAS